MADSTPQKRLAAIEENLKLLKKHRSEKNHYPSEQLVRSLDGVRAMKNEWGVGLGLMETITVAEWHKESILYAMSIAHQVSRFDVQITTIEFSQSSNLKAQMVLEYLGLDPSAIIPAPKYTEEWVESRFEEIKKDTEDKLIEQIRNRLSEPSYRTGISVNLIAPPALLQIAAPPTPATTPAGKRIRSLSQSRSRSRSPQHQRTRCPTPSGSYEAPQQPPSDQEAKKKIAKLLDAVGKCRKRFFENTTTPFEPSIKDALLKKYDDLLGDIRNAKSEADHALLSGRYNHLKPEKDQAIKAAFAAQAEQAAARAAAQAAAALAEDDEEVVEVTQFSSDGLHQKVIDAKSK